MIADVSEYLTTFAYHSDSVWADTFTEGVLTAAQGAAPADAYANGEIFWIPITMTGLQGSFFSNNEAIVESGRGALSHGKSDWWIKMTWDQTARGVTYDDVMSGDLSLSDEEFVAGFEAVADLHSSGFIPDGTMSLGAEEEQALFLSLTTVNVPLEEDALCDAVGDAGVVVYQSGQRVSLLVTGDAEALLAKGTSLDLTPRIPP